MKSIQFARTKKLLTSLLFSSLFSLIIIASNQSARADKLPTFGTSSDATATPTSTATTIPIMIFPITATTTITPSATIWITPTITLTPTPTQTISPTLTPTLTPTPTFSPTPTITPTPTSPPLSFLPLIIHDPTPIPYIPPDTVLFCDSFNNSIAIPDNNPGGIIDTIQIADTRIIVDLDVVLNIKHTWVGDLVARLTHVESGKSIDLIHRPGVPASDQGCWNNNVAAILDDDISSGVEGKCASEPAAISGIYIPNQALSVFDGDSIAGSWQLNVSDNSINDTGSLNGWCVVGKISTYGQTPTPTAPPPRVPPVAVLSGITGKDQALPLDCETRSAVDWAAYFGYHINEITFFTQLPHSDNPDKGFVGNVYDPWGQIPPKSYGVHAEPVAALLRAYGLPAYAHRPLSWDALRAEIAAGRPVIVWIIGSVQNGIPVYYTPSDGLHTVVARYEHTVVVTGYTNDSVYYLNGDTIYARSINQFLDSWSALGNMAITTYP